MVSFRNTFVYAFLLVSLLAMPFHGARAAPVGTRSVSVKLMRRMALEKAHMRRSYLAHHSATSLIQRGDIPGAVPYVRRDDPPDDDTTTTTQPAATTTDTTQPTPTTTDTTTPSPTGGSETITVTVTVTVTATPTAGGHHHNPNGSHHKPTSTTDDPNSTPTPTTTDTTQPTGTTDATTSPTPTATPTDDPNTPTTTTTDTTTSPTGSPNQDKRSRFVRRHHAENEKRGSYPVPRVFPRFARDEIVRRTASEEWRVRRDEPTAVMEKRKVGKEITDENVARDEPPTPTPTPTPTIPNAYYSASHDGHPGVARRNEDSTPVNDTPRPHGTHVDGRDVTSSEPSQPPVIQRRNLIMKPVNMWRRALGN